MNTIVTKILAVVVILVIVGAGVVPVIDALNTYTTEETETITFGTNTAHSATVTSERGTMSGTTFTEDADGDWIQIPLAILCNTPANTYKVLEGATIYAPDTNGDIAAFTITSGAVTGLNSALTVTLTQDTSITDATVYDMAVSSTDLYLSGMIIPLSISGVADVFISDVKSITTGSNGSYFITNSGDLYAIGTSSFIFGDGVTTTSNEWIKIASDISSVSTGDYWSAYLTTQGVLYSSNTSYPTWSLIASDVKDYWLKGYGSYWYVDNDGVGHNENNSFGTGISKIILHPASNNTQIMYITESKDLYLGYGTTYSLVASNVKDAALMLTGNNTTAQYYLTEAGDLYGKGSNAIGNFGLGNTDNLTNWTVIASNVDKIYVWSDTSSVGEEYKSSRIFYINTSGELYCAGKNYYGSLGLGTPLISNNDTITTWTKSINVSVTDIFCDSACSFTISSSGTLYVTGNNSSGALGIGSASTPVLSWTSTSVDDVSFVASYTLSSILIDDDEDLYGTGMKSRIGEGSSGNTVNWTRLSANMDSLLYTNSTESKTFTDVRGSIEGTTFTEDADGAYILVSWYNLPDNSYQIGNGEDYYTANGTTVTAFEAPSTTGVTDATLTFTQNSTDSNVYDVTGTTVGASYGIVVPYTVTYDITHTVTHERLPMLNLIPLILIIMSVLFVAASLIIDRRGY